MVTNITIIGTKRTQPYPAIFILEFIKRLPIVTPLLVLIDKRRPVNFFEGNFSLTGVGGVKCFRGKTVCDEKKKEMLISRSVKAGTLRMSLLIDWNS